MGFVCDGDGVKKMTQEKEIIKNGKFRVNGLRIIYDQPVYKMPDGSQQFGLSAPVCDIWEDLIDPENVAKEITHKLNTYGEMLAEMEKLAQALEDTGHEPPQSFYDVIKKAKGY